MELMLMEVIGQGSNVMGLVPLQEEEEKPEASLSPYYVETYRRHHLKARKSPHQKPTLLAP